MKLNKILLTLFAGLALVSCGDDLANLNRNPNVSTGGGNGVETFVSATAYYGVALDAYFNANDALYAQYWAGGPGVGLLDHERYSFEPADFNLEWSFSYNQALSDLDYTKRNGNEALASIADIFSVLIYQNLVDHYGSIPYSEALKGAPEDGGILAPKFDDAQEIYNDLIVRLDAAVATLSTTDEEVGEEDLIYNGDLNNWIAFANSLKLRLLMRQSITGDQAIIGQQVRNLIANGTFISNTSNLATIPFSGAAGNNYNPQYARSESGNGQFYVASQTTTDVLSDLNDPRALILYDPADATGTLVGLPQGDIDSRPTATAADFSFPTEVAYAIDNDVLLMSHWEVLFLRAEAAMRFGTIDDEEEMFNAAVTAHFVYVGLNTANAETYLATSANYDAGADQMVKSNMIGIQKWISMNGLQESEGWIESRRFDQLGSNVFTNPATGIFQTPTETELGEGIFPSIRLYPQSEISFNAAKVPKGRVITNKVFWDN